MTEGLLIGDGPLFLQCAEHPLGRAEGGLILTEDEQILPVQIQQHLGCRGPLAPHVVPVKGDEIKVLKALEGLDLALVDVAEHPGIHIRFHLPDPGEGQYLSHHSPLFRQILTAAPGQDPGAAGARTARRTSTGNARIER